MTDSLTREEIEQAVRATVEAQRTALGVEITTPVLYSNGDYVVVIVAPEVGGFLVHDAGLGSMRVAAEGMRFGREPVARIKSIAERYGCVVDGGRITRMCEAQDVGAAVALVANASRTVADLVVEIRRQNKSQFRYVVTEGIRAIVGARLREDESFKGASGITYRVPNVILDQTLQRAFVFAVPLASRSAVPTQFRELFDLKAAFPSVYNESIYNDASDFRPREDGWILEQVGDVVAISALRERLAKVLETV
ncbi:MAG TPA: hypothetical protein VNF04_03810 [Stellaceae bacterium]|nr:hypothetical protein [Stellaceae bacterium]